MKDFPDPTKLVILNNTDKTQISWSAVGWVDVDYARKFAEDVLSRCQDIELQNNGRHKTEETV